MNLPGVNGGHPFRDVRRFALAINDDPSRALSWILINELNDRSRVVE